MGGVVGFTTVAPEPMGGVVGFATVAPEPMPAPEPIPAPVPISAAYAGREAVIRENAKPYVNIFFTFCFIVISSIFHLRLEKISDDSIISETAD